MDDPRLVLSKIAAALLASSLNAVRENIMQLHQRQADTLLVDYKVITGKSKEITHTH